MEKAIQLFTALVICTCCFLANCGGPNYPYKGKTPEEVVTSIIRQTSSPDNHLKTDSLYVVHIWDIVDTVSIIGLSKTIKPYYPFSHFRIDTINNTRVVFEEGELLELKDTIYYREAIQRGDVIIDGRYHEDLLMKNYYIIFCKETGKVRTYERSEYYEKGMRIEKEFLKAFCEEEE